MKAEILNESFRIPKEEIEKRVGRSLNGGSCYHDLVPLKNLERVDEMSTLRSDVVDSLIRSIPLEDRSNGVIYPYADSDISVFRIEPRGFRVGQTFVLKEKVLRIMEDFQNKILEPFSIKGLSRLYPSLFYGVDSSGKRVASLYVPPIVEVQDGRLSLIDGMHRCYICNSVGSTVPIIRIDAPSVRAAYDFDSWDRSNLVDFKPSKEKRFHGGLRKKYYRDFGLVGIDG